MITGKFADAAIQNANDTKNATFNVCAPSAKRIETTEMMIEPTRAATTASFSEILPFLMIFKQFLAKFKLFYIFYIRIDFLR